MLFFAPAYVPMIKYASWLASKLLVKEETSFLNVEMYFSL